MREHGVHPAYATLASLLLKSGYRNKQLAFRAKNKMAMNSFIFKTVTKNSRQTDQQSR